jgi:hypothetical protein
MYSFIVLGIVPGTNLQIGFSAWLILSGLALVTFRLRHQIGKLAVTVQAVRQPLHASQLHQRAV